MGLAFPLYHCGQKQQINQMRYRCYPKHWLSSINFTITCGETENLFIARVLVDLTLACVHRVEVWHFFVALNIQLNLFITWFIMWIRKGGCFPHPVFPSPHSRASFFPIPTSSSPSPLHPLHIFLSSLYPIPSHLHFCPHLSHSHPLSPTHLEPFPHCPL